MIYMDRNIAKVSFVAHPKINGTKVTCFRVNKFHQTSKVWNYIIYKKKLIVRYEPKDIIKEDNDTYFVPITSCQIISKEGVNDSIKEEYRKTFEHIIKYC